MKRMVERQIDETETKKDIRSLSLDDVFFH